MTLTVNELINQLQKLEADLPVFIEKKDGELIDISIQDIITINLEPFVPKVCIYCNE